MGAWISHLRITEKLLPHLEGLDEAAFLFGNLAPDSGKPNEDWTQFDPPKEVTHYLKKGEGEGHIRDMQFCHDFLQRASPDDDNSRYSFLLGYFFHLLCDNLWTKWIGAASRRDYAALIEEKGIYAWRQMKEDWYGLDFLYVRDHPGSNFWQILMPAVNPPAYLPFLAEDALHLQLDYIRRFYSEPDPGGALDRPYPFLNEATMSRYVNDSVQVILDIHQNLNQLAQQNNSHTALALIPAEKLQPYEPPLGDKTR